MTVMLTRGWPTCPLGGDTQHTQSLESNRILACIDLAKVGDVKMAPNAAADGPPFHFSIQLDERVYMMRVYRYSSVSRCNLVLTRSLEMIAACWLTGKDTE